MSLSLRDHATIWHPYTQMKTAPLPLAVVGGEGASLLLEDGRRIVDGISSWWVNVHGHAHPHIAQAIASQAHTLEQVIFAGFTHPQAVQLAERLLGHLPAGMARIFFSDDGSTAVEVALKMAWQYWQQQPAQRQHIVALEHAYHGDTFGAMSASGRSIFTRAFDPLLFQVTHLPSPAQRPLQEVLQALEAAHRKHPVAAMIVEPLVQGAGGMRMYSASTLDALVHWCKERGTLVIFDEVMTGFYRTGKMFAANQIVTPPDIMCLSKGLTGGFLPLAVTACTQAIYAAFLSDDRAQMLFHGHSYTANALGCAAANASLDLFETTETLAAITRISTQMQAAMPRFQAAINVEDVRCTGTILAMNLRGGSGYLQDSGSMVAEKMLAKGVLMRPLGNVLYLMPPYCISATELDEMLDALSVTLESMVIGG